MIWSCIGKNVHTRSALISITYKPLSSLHRRHTRTRTTHGHFHNLRDIPRSLWPIHQLSVIPHSFLPISETGPALTSNVISFSFDFPFVSRASSESSSSYCFASSVVATTCSHTQSSHNNNITIITNIPVFPFADHRVCQTPYVLPSPARSTRSLGPSLSPSLPLHPIRPFLTSHSHG